MENRRLEKSLYSQDYEAFLELLRHVRVKAGLTQTEAAKRVGRPQSFISKAESGERRLDVIEFVALCRAYDFDVVEFVRDLTKRLDEPHAVTMKRKTRKSG